MKVLVIGISEQIGGDPRRLLRGRADVALVDRDAMDLSSAESFESALDRESSTVVVNPAVHTAVDAPQDHEAQALAISAAALGVMTIWLKARVGLVGQVGAPTDSLDKARFIVDCPPPRLSAGVRPLNGVCHPAAAAETPWRGSAVAFLQSVSRIPAIKAGLRVKRNRPIATSPHPTKAARPANSQPGRSKNLTAFGRSPRPWRERLDECVDQSTR